MHYFKYLKAGKFAVEKKGIENSVLLKIFLF